MDELTIHLDGNEIPARRGATILEAARAADVYLPALCAHPDLPAVDGLRGVERIYRGTECLESDAPDATWEGCGLCVVEVGGELVRACATEVAAGMEVLVDAPRAQASRRQRLGEILTEHPHACLTCAQAEGCPRTQCSTNVPEEERCCELLGVCELGKVAQYIGVPDDIPRYQPRGIPELTDEPLHGFFPELCIGCTRCVRACGDLRDVGTLAFVMRGGRPVVGTTVGPTRAESHCRFCGTCVEVCPTGALRDDRRTVGEERARHLVPCRDACPAGVDVPRLVRHVGRGEPGQAFAVLRERVPLAFAVSYACFHPCEERCRRGEVNEALSVCRLHRFTADVVDGEWRARLGQHLPTGRRVAVVGSGPAGLTAAYYLARKGHAVVVHEALGEPGGMLRVGIPEYRYPPALLQRDLAEITAAGVEIRTNSPVDAAGLKQLAAGGADAVFLAVGASVAKRIDVAGVELEHVEWGLDFLRRRALGELGPGALEGRRVLVIGGGNVAVDAARVARRLGAATVAVVSLEQRDELPAWGWEVSEAEEEQVTFLSGWGPLRLRGEGGRVRGVTLKRCVQVFDERGRFRPQYDEDDTRDLAADHVLLAIGQEPQADLVAEAGRRPGGTVEVDPETLETRLRGVYAGGDVASGPASVIEAVAMGRRAASRIDGALGGDGDIDEQLTVPAAVEPALGRREGFATLTRRQPGRPDPAARLGSSALVEETLEAEAAQAEAQRCLSCDLRLTIAPTPLPPRTDALLAATVDVVATVPAAEGVVQLFAEDRSVLAIRGVMDLHAELEQVLRDDERVRFFAFELDPMFTRRESELIQQYLQEHGQLPGGGQDDLDDLF